MENKLQSLPAHKNIALVAHDGKKSALRVNNINQSGNNNIK